jgi:hypothetical protein
MTVGRLEVPGDADDTDMWDIEPTGQCKLASHVIISDMSVLSGGTKWTLTVQIADQITEAFQLRVPPSKRTEGYRVHTTSQEKVRHLRLC